MLLESIDVYSGEVDFIAAMKIKRRKPASTRKACGHEKTPGTIFQWEAGPHTSGCGKFG